MKKETAVVKDKEYPMRYLDEIGVFVSVESLDAALQEVENRELDDMIGYYVPDICISVPDKELTSSIKMVLENTGEPDLYFEYEKDNTKYYANNLRDLNIIFDFSIKEQDLNNILSEMENPYSIDGGFLTVHFGIMPKRVIPREAAANIIDIFEDFLDAKGCKITPDANDIDDYDDNEDAANIYGSDYDDLMDSIVETLGYNSVIVPAIF